MRTCTKCNLEKPDTEYRKRRANCRTCETQRTNEWRQRNREKVRGYDRKRYVKGDRWHNHIRRKYGMFPDDYAILFEAQSGRCAICKIDKPGGNSRRFHVDHCHDTGQVRGLLCMNCNRMIGHARDNPEILSAAAKYVDAQY